MREKTPKQRGKAGKHLGLLLLLLAAAGIGFLLGNHVQSQAALPPDRAPEQDPNAVPYEEGSRMETGNSGAMTLRYLPRAQIDLSTGEVKLTFTDPPGTDQGIVIQLVVQGEVLAESGLLPPGTALYTMELLPGAAERLRPGSYYGSFLVSCYDMESGERAVLQTEARIEVTVTEGD